MDTLETRRQAGGILLDAIIGASIAPEHGDTAAAAAAALAVERLTMIDAVKTITTTQAHGVTRVAADATDLVAPSLALLSTLVNLLADELETEPVDVVMNVRAALSKIYDGDPGEPVQPL